MTQTSRLLIGALLIWCATLVSCQKTESEFKRTESAASSQKNTISVGDTEKHAQLLIDAHKGIPSRIAYTKTRDGVTIMGNPKLSYHFPNEIPIVMISIVDETVTEIELATTIADQPDGVSKLLYDFESVDSFSFSTIPVVRDN